MKRIVKFAGLTRPEKKIFARAIYLLIAWRIRLSRQSFEHAARHNSRSAVDVFASQPQTVAPKRISALLDAAAKIIPFTTCLSKAFAGQLLFSTYGYATRLHIGVGREDTEALKAHAWLTLDDKIITGFVDDMDKYKELPLKVH